MHPLPFTETMMRTSSWDGRLVRWEEDASSWRETLVIGPTTTCKRMKKGADIILRSNKELEGVKGRRQEEMSHQWFNEGLNLCEILSKYSNCYLVGNCNPHVTPTQDVTHFCRSESYLQLSCWMIHYKISVSYLLCMISVKRKCAICPSCVILHGWYEVALKQTCNFLINTNIFWL